MTTCSCCGRSRRSDGKDCAGRPSGRGSRDACAPPASNGVDLVARREEETRQAILDAATRSFASKGYRGTRMADLVEELGITPQVLYGHFATKRELFVACYKVAVHYMDAFLRPRFESARDSAEMQVWYMYADSGIKAFAPNLMMLAVEAAQHDEEARRDLREAYDTIVGDTVADFRSMRRSADRSALLRRAGDPRHRGGLRADARSRLARRRVLVARCVHNALGLFLAVQGGVPRRPRHQRADDQVRASCSTRSPSCRRPSRRSSSPRRDARGVARGAGQPG